MNKRSYVISALIILGIIYSLTIGSVGGPVGATQSEGGRIVVLADEIPICSSLRGTPKWSTSAGIFTLNTFDWLTEFSSGKRILKDSLFEEESTLVTFNNLVETLQTNGYTVDIQDTSSLTPGLLENYDALLIKAGPINATLLTEYVKGGGGVFLVGGTYKQSKYNEFLLNFGMSLLPAVHPGSITLTSFVPHPVTNGVSSLETLNPTPILVHSSDPLILATWRDWNWLVVYSQDGGRIHAVEEYTPPDFESPSVPSDPRIGVFIVTHGNPIGTQLTQLGLTYTEIPHSDVATFDLSSFDVLWIPFGDLCLEPSPEPEFRQAIQARRSELHTWVQNGGVLVVGVQLDSWQPVHSALDLLFEAPSINYQNARQEGYGATIYPDMMEHPLVTYPNQLTNTNPNLTSIHFFCGFESYDTKWQPVLMSSTGYPILMLREEQRGAYIALGFVGYYERVEGEWDYFGFEGREQILENIIMYSNPIGAPTVTVVSPNGGEYWQEIQTITWTATDPQNDPLTYTVYYSPNGGQTWTQLASGVTETSYQWDTSGVQVGATYLIKVEASDGILRAEDRSDAPFTVEREVPTETRSEAFFVPSFRIVEVLGAILVLLGLGKRQRRRKIFWERQ